MISIESGKEILRETRQKIYRPPKRKYPNLNYYIGESARTKSRSELINLLDYLINPQNEKNAEGEIQQRFFTAYNQYCFFMDTNTYTTKIRKAKSGKERSNHGINLLCALGFFSKDKDLERYGINQNFEYYYPNKRLMSIYHFNKINLNYIESQAKRLRNANITVGTISANNLKGAGLEDIAESLYFRNKESAYEKKLRELDIVLDTLETLVKDKGYATIGDIVHYTDLQVSETKKVLKAFRNDIDKLYHYGPPTKKDRQLYGYQFTRWIYTRKEQVENVIQDKPNDKTKSGTENI